MTEPIQIPLPYADPKLPTGSGGYQPRRYPSDNAGPLNGRVVDDGNLLCLQPSSLFSRRVIGVCFLLVVWSIFVVGTFVGNRHASSRTSPVIKAVLFIGIAVVGLLGPMVSARRRGTSPWIIVDRAAKMVHLPRENRKIPFPSVARLQLVSFAPVGLSTRTLSYRGEPPSGELQIVFYDAGKEQTWCVVYWPDPNAIKTFARAFRDATGIPVSRVYPTTTGKWHVEAFDGTAS